MSESALPPEILNFISRYIFTVGHLETLIFFLQNREQSFTADEIAREMRTNPTMAGRQLMDLAGALDITEGEPLRFKFKTTDTEQVILVVRLSESFKHRRQGVISAIYNPQIDTIRSFADAFKIKKD